MDGVTDAAMRAYQGATGAFTYAVSEFVRVSEQPVPAKVFRRDVPELLNDGRTTTGLAVQVQILGGDPERMAASALTAVSAGAWGIDLNFGCPAPVVNRNDGGASLLRSPCRIEEVVRAVREAVPPEIPVSAKMRLGWDDIHAIHEIAARAEAGGATWLTVHARTREQSYRPPVFWPVVGAVRARSGVPVVVNGDIWTVENFRRCRDETGCAHFMIGRGALADPVLPSAIARELGLGEAAPFPGWAATFRAFLPYLGAGEHATRLKSWLKFAAPRGTFPHFDAIKTLPTAAAILAVLDDLEASQ